MEIDQIYSELLLRIQSLETLYEQIGSHVFQTFNFLWAVIIGVFAIIGVALYFIAQQTAEKGLEKHSKDLKVKIDDYEKRITALEIESRETNKKLQEAIEYPAKLMYGSYSGNGVYGIENKKTLHLLFPPRLVIVFLNNSTKPCGMFLNPEITFAKRQAEDAEVHFSWEGDSITWYSSIDAAAQLNKAGEIYNYIVIG